MFTDILTPLLVSRQAVMDLGSRFLTFHLPKLFSRYLLANPEGADSSYDSVGCAGAWRILFNDDFLNPSLDEVLEIPNSETSALAS